MNEQYYKNQLSNFGWSRFFSLISPPISSIFYSIYKTNEVRFKEQDNFDNEREKAENSSKDKGGMRVFTALALTIGLNWMTNYHSNTNSITYSLDDKNKLEITHQEGPKNRNYVWFMHGTLIPTYLNMISEKEERTKFEITSSIDDLIFGNLYAVEATFYADGTKGLAYLDDFKLTSSNASYRGNNISNPNLRHRAVIHLNELKEQIVEKYQNKPRQSIQGY